MKSTFISVLTSLLFLSNAPLGACPRCRPLVQAAIHNADFLGNVVVMLLPVALLLLIGAALFFVDALEIELRKGAQTWRTLFGKTLSSRTGSNAAH